MFRKLLLSFSAGTLGALVSSLTVWLFGVYGITQALGVSIVPGLSANWLYPRLVWGGLWGLLFVMPWLSGRAIPRGLLLSLFPSAVQLLYFFPVHDHLGLGGISLGLLTPLVVLFFNAVWGVVTAIALKIN